MKYILYLLDSVLLMYTPTYTYPNTKPTTYNN